MKISTFSLFALVIIGLSACTNRYGIARTHAFIRENVSGTIEVDPQNRPTHTGVRKAYLIYLETPENQPVPQWESLLIDSLTYPVQPTEVTERVKLGKNINDQEVEVKPRPGYRLWQLVLTGPLSMDKQAMMDNAVVLKGTWEGKPFEYPIREQQKLQPVFHQ